MSHISISLTATRDYQIEADELRALLGQPDLTDDELVEVLEGDQNEWTQALNDRLTDDDDAFNQELTVSAEVE